MRLFIRRVNVHSGTYNCPQDVHSALPSSQLFGLATTRRHHSMTPIDRPSTKSSHDRNSLRPERRRDNEEQRSTTNEAQRTKHNQRTNERTNERMKRTTKNNKEQQQRQPPLTAGRQRRWQPKATTPSATQPLTHRHSRTHSLTHSLTVTPLPASARVPARQPVQSSTDRLNLNFTLSSYAKAVYVKHELSTVHLLTEFQTSRFVRSVPCLGGQWSVS